MDLNMNAIGSTGRGRGRRRAVAGALAALLLTAAACGSDSGSDSGSGDTSSGRPPSEVLGAKNEASGEPVKIGFISDGQTDVSDYSVELDMAAAAVEYVNDYKGGIAGRPIDLVTCETHLDPAKTADCANQLIQDDVVAILGGQLASIESAWQPIHDARIPYVGFAANSQQVLFDTESTFFMVDSLAALADVPMQVAKDNDQDKVTAVVIDLPTLTVFFQTIGPGIFEDQGMKLELVAIPPDQADMTPQMQDIASGDPGVVQVMGSPSFCTAAFNGLRAVGYEGPLLTISQCITDDVLQSVPGEFLEGAELFATSPVGDDSDPDVELYNAVVDTYAPDVDTSIVGGYTAFTTVTAFAQALEGITGDITPATVISTLKAMKEMPLPLGGGVKYRCNGKAVTLAPAVCTRGGLIATLGPDGKPEDYVTAGSTPIED
jgi:branched-chain amino acid transport system substrate-binding protein